ncbi:MAG: SPOR domain-containing protein, partial [Bradyrhizobium sp.]
DESDPLAELARLIGQADPLGTMGRANAKLPQRSAPPRNGGQMPSEPDDLPPAGPPRWMQRASAREIPREIQREPPPDPQREAYREVDSPNYPNPVHPLRRYAQPPTPQSDPHDQEPPYRGQAYQDEPPYAAEDAQLDPSRYDDALYGQIEAGAQDFQREPAYLDDAYADQGAYGEDVEEAGPKRRSGFLTIAAILGLAVIGGTGAAFAYRAYFAAPRNGEPPIIKADTSPTKIFPAKNTTLKVADRLTSGDGTEKIVPREEAPLDLSTQSGGPRVVLPPLNPESNPPTESSVPPSTTPATGMATASAAPGDGTWASTDPRPIKTIIVRGDQPDGDALPVDGAPSQPTASQARPVAPPASAAAASEPAPSRPAA